MSAKSAIEWTDATWNPVRGCTKVSPGCKHCYAEMFAERFRGVKGHPYEQGFDLRLVPDKLAEPLRWRTPKMVCVNSIRDQCAKARVPFFFKQWGGLHKKSTGRMLDGRTYNEFPRRVPNPVGAAHEHRDSVSIGLLGMGSWLAPP